MEWGKNTLDFGEVEQPAGVRIDLALAKQLDTKTVTMKARTLVSGRSMGQPMRGLESELAGQANPTTLRNAFREHRGCFPCGTASCPADRAFDQQNANGPDGKGGTDPHRER